MAKDGMQLFGDKQLEKIFKTLGDRVQRKVLRPAVNVAATPVVKAAKANAPKQSGLLKKSLGKKIVTDTKAQSVTAIIGPRRSVQGTYQGKLRKPSRYAHLVEKGYIDEAGRYVAAHPFLNPAATSTQSESLAILQDKLADGVVKEASAA